MFDIPTGWGNVALPEHPDETGKAFRRTKTFGNIRDVGARTMGGATTPQVMNPNIRDIAAK